MKRRVSNRIASVLAGLVACVCLGPWAIRAEAASAVLAKDGTLYEVFPASYGDVISGANASDASLRVLALRTTPPGGSPTVEVVGGTVNEFFKLEASIEFDEVTRSIFIVYSRVRGFFSDVLVTIRRDRTWVEGSFLPNPGLYISVSPQLLVTRQTYSDADADGQPITKSRTILSIVWWEESGASQARYAAVFVEDGNVGLDDVTAWNLNELNGTAGPTDNSGLPLSSYAHPGLQRDAGTSGGVLVSFANLATRTQQVVHLAFPDNLPKLVPPDGLTSAQRTSFARGHTPILRSFTDTPLPRQIDLPFQMPVGTVISPAGVPTFYWSSDTGLSYLSGGSAAVVTIPFRPDFPVDRALAVVKDMSEKE
ncbi:MAG: hypothetical protein ACHQM4_02985 [Thermoanaerobaculia bacterium]